MRETWKRLTVKLFPAEGHAREKKIFRSTGGMHFGAAAIEEFVDRFVDFLDKHPVYGAWEWRMVEVAPNELNFIYVGPKEAKAPSESLAAASAV